MARARATKKPTPPPARKAARAPTRRERRKRSSRLLSRVGVALAIAVPLLYFAFTKLLFNPFEDSQPLFPVLVPREVDVFAHRQALASDLETFPRPRLYERLVMTPEWKALAKTSWFQELGWPARIEQTFDEIEQSAAQAPLDPMQDLLGREVAFVGRWGDGPGGEGGGDGAAQEGAPEGGEVAGRKGADDAPLPPLNTAVLMRISDWAKLLVEALDFELVRERALPDAIFTKVEDPEVPGVSWRKLELPGQGTWYYARELDLLVLGDDETLVRDVLRTVQGTAQGLEEASIGLTRLYLENLEPAGGEPEDRLSVELALDPRPLLPAPRSPDELVQPGPDAMLNLVRRLFDPGILRGLVARLELDEGLNLRLHAELDAELASARRTGLLGTEAFGASKRLSAAFDRLPDDVSAVVVARLELKPMLQAVSASLDPDFLQLVDSTLKDLVRYTPGWGVDDIGKLIEYLDRTLTGEVTIAIRPLDHQIPAGSQPLPLIAFIGELKDAERWRKLDEAVVRGYKAFGLDREQMFMQNEGLGVRKWLGLPAGLPIEEISYIVLDGSTAVVTTDDDFLREIVAAHANSRTSLGSKPTAREMLTRLDDARANLVAWVSMGAARTVMDPYAEYLSERDTILDFAPLRLQHKADLLQGEFREWLGKDEQMPEEAKKKLNDRLDEILGEVERQRVEEQVPKLAEAWRERKKWLDLFDTVAVAVRLGERDMDLSVQATTALGGK